MSVTTLTPSGHVDGLTSGYKRSFNSIGEVAVGEFKRPASLPASALRNDRGTNATLPVARCCSIPLYPGEVAFVRTGKGLRSLGEGTNFLPIVSLSQINEMLLDNPVTPMQGTRENASNLLERKDSKHIFGMSKSKAVPLKYDEFDPTKMTDDLAHPLHAYALDGVVCSASDARDGQVESRRYTQREEAAGCNVAVGGQSPLVAASMKGQAVRMTSRVYVVLVANRVVSGTARPRRTTPHTPFFTGASASAAMNQSLFSTAAAAAPYGTSESSKFGREWVFQYELVTSAELDLDPAIRKFKVERISNNTSNRVPVKMWQLGIVTDLNSGHQSLPTQFTLNVNVRPFNGVATQKINTVDGKQSWVKLPPSRSGPQVVFFPPSKAEQRKQKANYMLPANAYLRRMRGHRTCFDRGMAKQCGFAAAVTGPSTAEFEAFKAAMRAAQADFKKEMIARLTAAQVRLVAAEAAAKAAEEAAKKLKETTSTDSLDVKQKIDEVSRRVDDHNDLINAVQTDVAQARQETQDAVDAVDSNSADVEKAMKATRDAIDAAQSANGEQNRLTFEKTEAVEKKFAELEESVKSNNAAGLALLRDIQEFKGQIGLDWESQKENALAIVKGLTDDVAALSGAVGTAMAPLRNDLDEIKTQIGSLEASSSVSKDQAASLQTAIDAKLESLQNEITGLGTTRSADVNAVGELKQGVDDLTTKLGELFNEIADENKLSDLLDKRGDVLLESVRELLDQAFSDSTSDSSNIAKEAQTVVAALTKNGTNEEGLSNVLKEYLNKMEEIDRNPVGPGGDPDPRIAQFNWLEQLVRGEEPYEPANF